MLENEPWVYQLDWSNIVNILGLENITQIPESKREKALKKVSKSYGSDLLLTLNPHELDELVANELKDLMKKDLILLARQKQKEKREIQAKTKQQFKNAGIIGIDLNDMKDIDPEDIVRFFNKAMRGNDEDDEKDDDRDKYDDDRNGYYI